MSDEAAQDGDKPQEPVDGQRPPADSDGQPPASADKGGEDKFFWRTFRTPEDADKGWREVQGAKTKAEQEAAVLRAKMEVLEEQRQSQSGAKDDATRRAEAERMRKEWLEQFTEADESERARLVLESIDQAHDDARQLTEREFEAKLKKYEDRIAQLEQQTVENSPEFQEVRDRVKELQADPEFKGFQRKQLVAIAKRENKLRAEMAPRSEVPGTTASKATPSDGDGPKRLSDQEKAAIRSLIPDASDEELKAIEKKGK